MIRASRSLSGARAARSGLVAMVLALTVITAVPVAAETLPLRRVILSTSGLAHFEHAGTVQGDVVLALPVRLDQVDDLLKSLVIFDEEGRIGSVSVPGREPLAQAFRDLPFARQDLNDPVRLLNALQGAAVAVRGETEMAGRLVRVVPFKRQVEGGTLEAHRVTVLTQAGLRSAVLEDLDAVRFTEEAVQAQLEQGLRALHANRVRDQRTLSIALQGGGTREVAMAYVVSAPLWKAAYRMVLEPPAPADDGAPAKSLIQGWAVVENMTGSDWTDVELTLVSGNPVTFRQRLYESYYAPRPILPVEVMGRVTPRVDQGNLGALDELQFNERAPAAARADRPPPFAEGRGRRARAMGTGDYASMAPEVEVADTLMMQTVAGAAAAESEDATTQMLFRFPQTYSVPSGHSLMVPFIAERLEVERVAMYQPDTHRTHPLSAIDLDNSTEVGFPPGILTLYERTSLGGTAYVGDAQVPVLPKGDGRYITYALDSKTQIDRRERREQTITAASIADGMLRTQVRRDQTTVYTIKAPTEEDRVVLLEHPRVTGWELVAPEGEQVRVTTSHYRIRVPVSAGSTERVEVTRSRTDREQVGLAGQGARDYLTFAETAGELDPELKAAFERMAQLREDVARLERDLAELERQRDRVFEDQERLRRNLARVPNNSDLGRRYLDKLDEQEGDIETLEARIDTLRAKRREAEDELRRFIGDLKL